MAKDRRPAHQVEFLKLPAPQRKAWIHLLAVHRGVTQPLDEALQREHGISLAEWDALVHLPEGEGVRMTDLASVLLLTPSGLTRMMARLEERGLVARRRGTEDARESYASLTRKGAEVLAKAAPLHNEELRAHFLAPLGPDDAAALAHLLGKVAAATPACPRHPAPAPAGAAAEAAKPS